MAGQRSRTAMSSGDLEKVLDGGGRGHSIFARAFLDVLQTNEAVLDGQALFDAIKGKIVLDTVQTPQYGDIRFAEHGGGDFLFVPRDVQMAALAEQQSFGPQRGAGEEMPAATADTYGGRDARVFDVIEDSDIAKDFEDFVSQFPDSAFAPYARNRIALLQQREPATPAPSVAVQIDPATEEAGLSLRPEDRRAVQEALTALGFDTHGTDGIFGANTRGAIGGWQRSSGDEPTGYLSAVQYGRLLAEAEPKLAALAAARQKPEQTAPVQPAVGVYQYQIGDEFRDCEDCPLMVVVPAGSFMMGSPPGEAGRYSVEGPQHQVTIAQPFAVGKYEVTEDEWDACVADDGCEGTAPVGWKRGRQPAIVSWEDAQAYLEWLSKETGQPYRLLSEAEWEYAARAGTTTRYWWGDKQPTAEQANFGLDVGKTTEVGTYPANPGGLHDMHGNVWEWVEDCWNVSYQRAPSDGSAWTSGNCIVRVLRGGSWIIVPEDLRSAYRGTSGTDGGYDIGFRVARTLTP
jgi:formylglycine-generating enzyme required for sulfatase activity